MTLQQKGQVIDKVECGMKVVNVASSFQVNESTIRTILSNKEKIRQSLKAAAGDTSKVVKRASDQMLIKVDKLLALYVRRQEKAGISVSRETCCIKARKLHDEVSKRMGVPLPGQFKASKAWVHAFFKRHGFSHKKAQGEQQRVKLAAAAAAAHILKGHPQPTTECLKVPLPAPQTATNARPEEVKEEPPTPTTLVDQPRPDKRTRPVDGDGRSAPSTSDAQQLLETLEKLIQEATVMRDPVHDPLDVVDQDPDLVYWQTFLEGLAKDCRPIKGVYRSQLKMEFLAVTERFYQAQKQGDPPGPDLMLHTLHGITQQAPAPAVMPIPLPTTSAGIACTQRDTSQQQYTPPQPAPASTSASIPAVQVALLQGAIPHVMSPVETSIPIDTKAVKIEEEPL